VWAAIRYRRAQALALALLSALITACAVFAPLYERSLEQSLLREGLKRNDVVATSISLDTVAVRGVPPLAAQTRKVFPAGLATLYDQGSETWSGRVRYTGLAGRPSKIQVVGSQDTCRGLQVITGACPTKAYQVLVSEAEATLQRWSVGTELTPVEDILATEFPAPFPSKFTVVGTYHQVADPAHWLGIGLEGRAGVYSPGLYLTAEQGRLVAVTGPSGAGQSTLLWVIAGAVRPTAGEVNVGEVRIDHRDRAIGEQVGLIPQGNGLATVLTARENISIPLLASGAGADDARRRTEGALAALGLDESGDHLVEELSGGQQQRVAVAHGVAVRSRVLLADEPTSELDHGNRERVLALLRAQADQGAVVIMATHDPEAAASPMRRSGSTRVDSPFSGEDRAAVPSRASVGVRGSRLPGPRWSPSRAGPAP